ncbi:MAG TPA: helicase C-terminal domain-containing protein [Chloroflexia bacterium]|nr:helicase C-terminal domain-containing protein [Chloroflexia bacterium]
MGRTYIALDTEATGLRADADEIIEIGAVKFRDGQILERWQSFIRPSQPIPYKITALTGISWQDVRKAPAIYVVAPAVLRFVADCPIVGHSIEIDLALLKRQGVQMRNRAYDTFELATLLLPEVPVYNLAGVATALGLTVPTQHRAVADAELAMHVFCALVDRLQELPVEVLAEINRATATSEWPLRHLFQEVEREAARTSFNLPLSGAGSLAGKLAAAGFSQTEFDLGLLHPPEQPPPLEDAAPESLHPIDIETLVAAMGAGGPVAQTFPAYEIRPQQVDMLRSVARAFNEGGHLMVEAGTGTGKSLAYLLPAIQFALQNKTRIVVATNTINLQDQLFYKDLPALARVIQAWETVPGGNGRVPVGAHAEVRARPRSERKGPPEPKGASDPGREARPPFRAAVLKGRSNYLCLRRWASFRKQAPPGVDELRTLVKVLIWLPNTHTGDRSELLLVNAEPQVWNKITVSVEGCPLHECVYNQKGLCFFHRAKTSAAAAHILVVNHALLLADIATGNRVLPPYQHLIIDEAHHLEDEATDQLGYQVTQNDVGDLSGQLSRGSSDRYEGFLADLRRQFEVRGPAAPLSAGALRSALQAPARVHIAATTLAAMDEILARLHSACARLSGLCHELFSCLHRILDDHSEERNEYDKRLRITARVRKEPHWGEVELAWDNLSLQLAGVLEDLNQLMTLTEEEEEAQSGDLANLLLELSNLWQQAETLHSHLNAALTSPSNGAIYWLSSNARDETTTLHCAPLHVGELLDRYLFATKRTVVLTSATLSTDGDFAYVRERLGLHASGELQVGSPFDYVNSTMLYIPDDLPEPNQPGYQRQLEQTILDLSLATHGRALVLFTSHSALRTTYRALQRPLEEAGLLLLGHNLDGSRRQLLERFRTTPRSVLMGTSSFWEGIDVVGDALSVLVITKLPFRVPSDPIFAARSEQFDDAFAQYSLPQAILKFKQGFGRLIRSHQDRGVVAILDRRLVSKGYGHTFLNSLPVCTLRRGPAHNLAAAAAAWLAPRDQAAEGGERDA